MKKNDDDFSVSFIKLLLVLIVVFVTSMIMSLCSLSGGRHKPDDNTPLSYWLNERNGCSNDWSTACVQSTCVTKSARAIASSGRPYPNRIRDEKTGKLIKYDVWIGTHLYEMSAEEPLLTRWEGYPKSHPFAYHYFSTSVSGFLDVPREKFMDTKVAGTLDGMITCADNAETAKARLAMTTVASSVNGAVEVARKYYTDFVGGNFSVKVIDRKELGMIEVLAVDQKSGEIRAAYVPYENEMTQVVDGGGYYGQIYCSARYDPNAAFNVASNCMTTLYLDDGFSFDFKVYQQLMPYLPAVQNRIQTVLASSKRD